MARNRKYQSAAIRFGPALKAFLLCLLIGGSGVGYVWQKNQIVELGQQIRKRELRLTELDDQNEKLKKQLAMMRSPQFLEQRIQELNLGLAAAAAVAGVAADRAAVPAGRRPEPNGNTPQQTPRRRHCPELHEFCRRP